MVLVVMAVGVASMMVVFAVVAVVSSFSLLLVVVGAGGFCSCGIAGNLSIWSCQNFILVQLL